MRPLQDTSGLAPAVLADGASSDLTLPPPNYALVPSAWNRGGSVVPEFDVEVWGDDSRAITGATLYGATPHPLAFADLTVVPTAAVKASLDLSTKTTNCNSVVEAAVAGLDGDDITIAFVHSAGAPAIGALTNIGKAYTFTFLTAVTTVTNFEAAIAASADLDVKTPGTGANILLVSVDEFAAANLASGADAFLTAVAHGKLTGDGPVKLTTTGTFPAGTNGATSYYLVKLTADTLALTTSLVDALSGAPVVDFTTAGTGTRKVVETADTSRLHWHAMDLLGPAADGAISVDGQSAWLGTFGHHTRVVAYAIAATLGAGGGAVSAALYPRIDRE